MKKDIVKKQPWGDMLVSFPSVWGEMVYCSPSLTVQFSKRPGEFFKLVPATGKTAVTHRAAKIQ